MAKSNRERILISGIVSLATPQTIGPGLTDLVYNALAVGAPRVVGEKNRFAFLGPLEVRRDTAPGGQVLETVKFPGRLNDTPGRFCVFQILGLDMQEPSLVFEEYYGNRQTILHLTDPPFEFGRALSEVQTRLSGGWNLPQST